MTRIILDGACGLMLDSVVFDMNLNITQQRTNVYEYKELEHAWYRLRHRSKLTVSNLVYATPRKRLSTPSIREEVPRHSTTVVECCRGPGAGYPGWPIVVWLVQAPRTFVSTKRSHPL